jgi:hypothetical protein
MRKATPEEQALWPAPNFENPEQLQAPVIGATVTTFLLAVLCKSSRRATALDIATLSIRSAFRLANIVYHRPSKDCPPVWTFMSPSESLLPSPYIRPLSTTRLTQARYSLERANHGKKAFPTDARS